MTVKWHKFGIQCPVCRRINFRFETYTNASGQIMFRTRCVSCKQPLSYSCEMVSLVFQDTIEDAKKGGLSEIQ